MTKTMLKTLFRVLIYGAIIIATMLISPILVENKGYVLISIGKYNIESSFIGFSIILVLILGLIQVFEWLIIQAITLISKSRYLSKRLRKKSAQKHSFNATIAMACSQWELANAEQEISLKNPDESAANLIASAYTFHQLGQADKRDQLMLKAFKLEQDEQIKLVMLHFYSRDNNVPAAEALIAELSKTTLKSKLALSLLNQFYQHSQQWGKIIELLPSLKKAKLLSSEQLEDQRALAVLSSFKLKAFSKLEELELAWKQLGRQDRKSTDILKHYFETMIVLAPEKAEKMLSKRKEPELQAIYGQHFPAK